MASPSRRSPRDLTQALARDASQFGFFQAVRLLGLCEGSRRQRRTLPARLRFRTLASLSFPASELVQYQPADEEGAVPAEMTVSFMGLTGPSGVLPTAYTELLLERRQQFRDTTLHAFLDLFSHRAIALFYAAWRKYRFWLAEEAGEQDGFSRNLLDLAGVGLSRLRGQAAQDGLLDERLFIYYAGLLSQKPLSALTLQTLVEGLFGTRAQLQQFAGQWLEVPLAEQSRLGSQSCELGVSLFAGGRQWDRQTKLQLRLGSLRRAQFEALLPGGDGARALQALMQFAVGHQLAVDVQLVLDKRDVPPARLDADSPLRLGASSWLGAQAADPDHVRYALLH
ncbi:type VI secretion system baseplate subunit TssG [Pseudogulbenkiania sp. MAI-1]|uniref:type VI secretion system baseplate subunit TssG n=1 Tax=Pseudogulbenkiania sp. MAI-1 TaxID=990370 RepID=UPI0004A2F254|nr:type VI secretion system baseplate subunit TssG [Pseudogulbenkiania sp. MAI-1]